LGISTRSVDDQQLGPPAASWFLRKGQTKAHTGFAGSDERAAEGHWPRRSRDTIRVATVDDPGTRNGVVVTELGELVTGQLGFRGPPASGSPAGELAGTPTQAACRAPPRRASYTTDGPRRTSPACETGPAGAWYPDDRWRYVAGPGQWRRIQPGGRRSFGRCGEVGDRARLGHRRGAAPWSGPVRLLALLITGIPTRRTAKWPGGSAFRPACPAQTEGLGDLCSRPPGAQLLGPRANATYRRLPKRSGPACTNGLGLDRSCRRARVFRPFHNRPFQGA